MKKLRLELDDVRVESYDTTGRPAHRGTVVGHITAAMSCYDSDCCTGNVGCVDSYNTGPCECASPNYTGHDYLTCSYSCMNGPCP